MNKEKYLKILSDLDLSEHESSVYFAMISIGPSPILKISKASEVKRTTVYSVIESLKQKGLAREDIQGFKTLYTAESPDKLLGRLESKKEKLKENLTDLMSIYNKGEKDTIIKIYENWDSIKNVYQDMLDDIKPSEEYLVISSMSEAFGFDKEFFTELRDRRAKLPINVKVLISDPETKVAQDFKKFERNFNLESKYISKDADLTTNLVVTPQKVLIHKLGEPTSAIVIENKDIIKMHQEFFSVMWNSSEG